MTNVVRLVTTDAQPPERALADAPLEALLARVAEGDEPAFGELYDRVVGKLYQFSLAILGSVEDAEEVVEDVMVKAWYNAAAHDSARGTVMTWLLTMCRSRALDRLRAGARDARLKGALVGELADGTADPFGHCADVGRLCRALEALPEPQRQVVSLAYFRGMSQSEIAQTLSMSLGTVKTHVRRTLLKLQETLA